MKKKTLFSLLGLALCSMVTMAQTYKLHDMTQEEFAAGGNEHFSFSEYRLASGTYSPFTLCTDSGRVNYVDVYGPERFQEQPLGEYTTNTTPANNKYWYEPLTASWINAEGHIPVNAGSGDKSRKGVLSFMYVARVSDTAFETYPTLLGTASIGFKAPAEGYYKVTTSVMREDVRDLPIPPRYLTAKFRFRQNGETFVDASNTMGVDYNFGDLTDPENTDNVVKYAYTDNNLLNGNPLAFDFYKTVVTPRTYYVHLKVGDMITAEADVSHQFGAPNFLDSTNYWVRDAWGRTRWTQFEVEVSTQEVAEASTEYVDPYLTGPYIDLFYDLVTECADFLGTMEAGVNIGQYDQSVIDEFQAKMEMYVTVSDNPNLLVATAKAYYEKLLVDFEVIKGKAYKIDYSQPENRWLFQVPTGSTLYADFEKQFLPKDNVDKAANSPWDFKTYTVSTGIYNAWTNFGTGSTRAGAVNSFYNGANDYLFIVKSGAIHPTVAISPVITFKAAEDGLYHASTSIQRDKGNKNNNFMYTRYRYIKGGIEDGVSSVDKEDFMFADAYGNPSNNTPLNRDFYVSLKAGDVITFEEDCYTANSNGSGGSTWEKLMVMKVPTADVDSVINANEESYFDPYSFATDFVAIDSVINMSETFLADVQAAGKVSDTPEVGQYPEAAVWDLEDVISGAKDVRANDSSTQVEVNAEVKKVSNAFATFLASLEVRVENNETFTSGAYYIEKDGLYLTVDSFWTTGTASVRMYAHFEPMIDNTIKNNQVFNVQFNEEYTEPFRYTITSCVKNETWEDDGAYHITEKGEIRLGGTVEAQSNTNDNHTWRNHSLIYNGDKWCIFNVKNNWSIVFTDNLSAFPTMPKTKEYLYDFIAFGTPGVDVNEVNGDNVLGQIIATVNNGVIELYSTQATSAVVYDASNRVVAKVNLGAYSVNLNLPSGFYIVEGANGAVTKVIVP